MCITRPAVAQLKMHVYCWGHQTATRHEGLDMHYDIKQDRRRLERLERKQRPTNRRAAIRQALSEWE